MGVGAGADVAGTGSLDDAADAAVLTGVVGTRGSNRCNRNEMGTATSASVPIATSHQGSRLTTWVD